MLATIAGCSFIQLDSKCNRLKSIELCMHSSTHTQRVPTTVFPNSMLLRCVCMFFFCSTEVTVHILGRVRVHVCSVCHFICPSLSLNYNLLITVNQWPSYHNIYLHTAQCTFFLKKSFFEEEVSISFSTHTNTKVLSIHVV